MGNFTFYALTADACARLGLPGVPIPVRRDRQAAIFGAGEVDLAALVEELAAFLSEGPEHRDVYESLQAALCYIAGIDAAGRGEYAAAERFFRLGLAASPQHVALRGNYGLLLHLCGHHPEARREYERVVASMPPGQIMPILWMMLSRLYLEVGEYGAAYALLKDVGKLSPDLPGFWEALGEAKAKAEAGATSAPAGVAQAPGPPPPAPAARARFCASCGTPVEPKWKFCRKCGAKIG